MTGSIGGVHIRTGYEYASFFCKVCYERVYFLCAERIATGSGFQTPAAPPVHLKVECPPPPPPVLQANDVELIRSIMSYLIGRQTLSSSLRNQQHSTLCCQ